MKTKLLLLLVISSFCQVVLSAGRPVTRSMAADSRAAHAVASAIVEDWNKKNKKALRKKARDEDASSTTAAGVSPGPVDVYGDDCSLESYADGERDLSIKKFKEFDHVVEGDGGIDFEEVRLRLIAERERQEAKQKLDDSILLAQDLLSKLHIKKMELELAGDGYAAPSVDALPVVATRLGAPTAAPSKFALTEAYLDCFGQLS